MRVFVATAFAGMGGELCRWQQGSNTSDPHSGRCVPTHCEAITNATECSARSGGMIACAWINASTTSSIIFSKVDDSLPSTSGRCIFYDGNCSVLPSESSCSAMDGCKSTLPV